MNKCGVCGGSQNKSRHPHDCAICPLCNWKKRVDTTKEGLLVIANHLHFDHQRTKIRVL